MVEGCFKDLDRGLGRQGHGLCGGGDIVVFATSEWLCHI